MPNFSLPIPGPMVEDQNLVELPSTSRIGGTALEAFETAIGTPIGLATRTARDFITREADPGKLLSSEEYENSQWKVPNRTYPKGISENVARSRYHDYVRTRESEAAISSMPPGFLTSVSKLAGTFLGAAITMPVDPIEGGTAALSTKLMGGKLAPWLLSKVADMPTVTRLTKAGLGAAEAATVATPFSLSQYETQKEMGENPTELSAIANIGLAAIAGGTIRTLIGYKKFIPVDEHLNVNDIASDHVAHGKNPVINSAMKNARYQAINSFSPEDLQNAQTALESHSSELESLDNDISKTRNEIDEKAGIKGSHKLYSGKDILNRIVELNKTHEDLLSEEDKQFLQDIPKNEAMQEAVSIKSLPESLRSEDQRLFLEDFQNGKEKELTQNNLNSLEEEQRNILSKISETPEEERPGLSDRFDRLSKRIEEEQKRISELSRLESEEGDLQKLRTKHIDQIEQRRRLFEAGQNTKILIGLMNQDAEPVSAQDLRNDLSELNSNKSNMTYNPEENSAIDDELENIPNEDEALQMAEEETNRRRDADLLNEEQLQGLKEIEEEEEDEPSVRDSIIKLYNCLKGQV